MIKKICRLLFISACSMTFCFSVYSQEKTELNPSVNNPVSQEKPQDEKGLSANAPSVSDESTGSSQTDSMQSKNSDSVPGSTFDIPSTPPIIKRSPSTWRYTSDSEPVIKDGESDLLDAQQESGELDSLFDQTEDVEGPIIEKDAPSVQEKDTKRGVQFSGHVEASALAAGFYADPGPGLGYGKFEPGANFIGRLSFTARPTDYFNIKGTMQAQFPDIVLGIYELYCNYTIANFALFTFGQRDIQWGHSHMFDTNILDDQANTAYDPNKVLQKDPRRVDDSRFSLMLTLPIPHFTLTGGAFYKDFKNEGIKGASLDNIYWACMAEIPVSMFTFSLFGRTWANNDPEPMDPAIGIETNFDLGRLHFYAQYFTHIAKYEDHDYPDFPRMKATASVWWMQENPIKLGFVLEYQFVFSWDGYAKTKLAPSTRNDLFNHYLAFQGAWANMFGSPFTLAVKFMHDFSENYGTVIPGVRYSRKAVTGEIGIPIYYGNPAYRKYGGLAKVTLSIDF